MRNPPPKKSEVIELRLPYDTKTAFMTKVRQEGTTASAVLRAYIEAYLERSAERRHVFKPMERPMKLQLTGDPTTSANRHWRSALAAFTTLLGLGAVALVISPANAVPDLAAAFEHLDADGDGVLTPDEFSGAVSRGAPPRAVQGDQTVVNLSQEKPSSSDVLLTVGEPTTGSGVGFLARLHHSESLANSFVDEPAKAEFANLDADGDSVVDFEEFASRHRAVLATLFEAIDNNRDGFADATELGSANADGTFPSEFVAALDINADGRLSKVEFRQQ